MLPYLRKNIQHHILGRGLVADDIQDQSINQAFVAIVKFFKRLFIASGDQSHQGCFQVRLGWFHETPVSDRYEWNTLKKIRQAHPNMEALRI